MQILEATVTTPDNPSSQDPHADRPEDEQRSQGRPDQQSQPPRRPDEPQAEGAAEQRAEPAADPSSVSPQDALRDLGQQPRIDEQGHPTAYTAVPPPLDQQQPRQPQQPQQPTWQPPSDSGRRSGYDQQPPMYGQQDPYAQPAYDQPPTYGQQPPSYASAPQGQPGQPGQPGPQGQPGQPGQPGPQGQPGQQQQPGYGYPPPPPPESGPQYGGGQYGVTGQPPGMPPYARWGQRAGAWLIDNIVAVIGIGVVDAAYYNWGDGPRVTGWILAVIGVVWALYNAYLAGTTGQSTGKRLLNIRLARYADGQVVGPAFALLRLFMNVVFWVICFIPGVLNYLWPLWDQKSQTWSDKIATSVVVQTR